MRFEVTVKEIIEYLKTEIDLLNTIEKTGKHDPSEGLNQYGRDRRVVLYELYCTINNKRIKLETEKSKRRISSYR